MSASVMLLMPSWYTSPATTRAPNAIEAMIAAFAPASNPSTSADGRRIGGDHRGTDGDAAVLGRAPDRDRGHVEADAGARFDLVSIAQQQLDEGTADVAAAEDTDPHRLTHTAKTVDGAGRWPGRRLCG